MRILALGMHAVAEGELSYEARSIHHIANMGHHVDYWTDNIMDYSMEPVLKKPSTLRNFMFYEGARALQATPRRFHPKDLQKIFRENQVAQPWAAGSDPYDVIYSTATTGIDMGVFLRDMLEIPLVVQWLDIPYWRLDPMLNDEIYKHSPIHLPILPKEMFDAYQNEWAYWFSNLPNIDLVSTILQVTKGQLLEYAKRFNAPLAPEKVHVTYHGSIDADTLDYVLASEAVEKKNQVICVNRIDFHKGVDQTLLAAKMIQDRVPNPPEFVFVSRGNAQWYENMIQEMAKAMLKRVVFTGWVDNMTKFRLIRESKVMLDCEWPEGFGGCNIGEAIYCGCVPVVWNRKSKEECYPTGAVRVPLDDYESMAEAAARVLTKGEFPITENDRKFVREFRSIESHAKGLVEAFEKVVK